MRFLAAPPPPPVAQGSRNQHPAAAAETGRRAPSASGPCQSSWIGVGAWCWTSRARRAPSRSSPTCSSPTPATTSASTSTPPTAPTRPTTTSPCCAPRLLPFSFVASTTADLLKNGFDRVRLSERGNEKKTCQVEQDLAEGVAGAVPVPPDEAGKDEVIAALVANVEAMIDADRKITSLKQLQGHIWRTGFEGQEIKGVVFDDVPPALERWHANGIKTYIYSSGSREAQRLIFGNTTYGDLRKYLCGFFDTMVGTKREPRSYSEIWQSVGVDRPSQILFLTDVYQEATAAKAAGLEVLISIRPGNTPLPENHGFQTITTFAEILT
ncbi:hypothetical protein PVAP13_5NG159300 [Panicum virgatum]|uniref:Uncharacterized protein n=1 Tax=Panicum virgatum TaxID=38727 RepID=A0A8T0RRU6_PANVG|nr:hypothetical protein PVAP13_5NG159300 [Panicum virgatum]